LSEVGAKVILGTVETVAKDDVDGSRRRLGFPGIGDRGVLGVVRFAPATDDFGVWWYKGESPSGRGYLRWWVVDVA
jgi:hypothetical protein